AAPRPVPAVANGGGRTASIPAVASEGWDAWFLDGFSVLSTGLRGVGAAAAWLVWTIAGISLIVLGIRLFSR
ncbi:MAG: hypothetical protein HYZ91_06745, partial [Candidatus Omnitrophica bacterium]|nr:hypothetical protein [Candidatus Omnitrophota bacterium]